MKNARLLSASSLLQSSGYVELAYDVRLAATVVESAEGFYVDEKCIVCGAHRVYKHKNGCALAALSK